MTDNTQPEALRDARWYMVDKDGMATLCTDREDAEQEAKDANMAWPYTAPHRAVQLVEVGTAAAELHRQHARIVELEAQLEAIGAGGVSGPLIGQAQAMPDLSALTERGAQAWAGVDAQGLREGVTSAGSEPVAPQGNADAILSKICDLFLIGKLARTESTILTNIRNVIYHAGLLHAVERDLFPQPELPEDDDPYAEVDEGLPAPNSWAAKDEADYVAQFRAALAARGFTHPSPPEGMAGGWMPMADAPRDGTLILAAIYIHSSDGTAEWQRHAIYFDEERDCTYLDGGDDTGWEFDDYEFWTPLPPPPTTPAGSGKGE